MDKVKAALTDFTARSGHHDTTVHEAVAPAVVHETIKPHIHEEINTAVDKEVHQDHYHRTVQPIMDREVLPETHTAKLGAVQHREFDHREHDVVKRNLMQEQAQFKDERRIESTTQSQSVAATIGGEHIHHHIHETIQPVVKKEVIQPNVVHTTVPIHEVHHNKATHHGVTALPTMTMDDFKRKGGVLSGREERYDEFQGVPKNIGGGTEGGFGHIRDGHHDGHHKGAGLAGAGLGGAGAAGIAGRQRRGSSTSSSDREGVGRHSSRGTGKHIGTDGAIGHSTSHGATGQGINPATGKKPSLMDKLNPKVDANGDGKAGFMK